MVSSVHFIGIGGSGLSAMAVVLLERGCRVSGSDRQNSPLLEHLQQAGARIFLGHSPEHIAGAELVVRSSAVRDDNPEVQAARLAGIPVLKRSDFLPHLTAGQRTIAVAGTHGKTTTTSMIAWMLARLGLDPSYVIGGLSVDLGGNAHAGQGAYFVIEADEYDRMFHGLDPYLAVVTNIEHDHPDCYPTPDDFFQAFQIFAGRLVPDGALLACANDPGAARLLAEMPAAAGQRRLAYQVAAQMAEMDRSPIQAPHAAYQARPAEDGAFEFLAPGAAPLPVRLQLPGQHNIANAAAALAVAHLLDLPLTAAAAALGEFRGAGRRFDLRGEAGGVTLIDDYAHHPTEIRATLAAARSRYPGRRVWAAWQPHTYSRTRTLFEAFTAAFDQADGILVTEIYAAREPAPADGFSGRQLADAIQSRRPATPVLFAPTLDDALAQLRQTLQPGDVLLVLSAGDADQITARLAAGAARPAGSAGAGRGGRYPALQTALGPELAGRLQFDAPLARCTAARLGGPAEVLLEVASAAELEQAVRCAWQLDLPMTVLGGGSNVLISDRGIGGLVLVNRARALRFDLRDGQPQVWAESGAALGLLARLAGEHGYRGLEWAAGIPGALGGAIVGNAGAHGGDMAGNLQLAELLHRSAAGEAVRTTWPVERLEYAYRTSWLKHHPGQAVVLAAWLKLEPGDPAEVQQRMDAFNDRRRKSQPPGASLGSMFKNPPGDYAGRLIEAAGLKGTVVGRAQISPLHANFFINLGGATAADYYALIQLAHRTVAERFGIELDLEVELLGRWE